MVDEKTVRKLAALARLHVEESEIPAIQAKVGAVLGYVERLSTVDVTGVAPMTHVEEAGAAAEARWFREDQIEPPLRIEALLQNAPSAAARFIKVPIIIEQSGD